MKKSTFFIIVLLLAVISACTSEIKEEKVIQNSFLDLYDFRTRGKIIAVTDFNSTNYFIYKGEPMGFHYELLKSFSDYSGLNIEIIPENDINKSIDMLNSGQADLLAIDLAITSSRESIFSFTESMGRTRQVLVQRKPNRWSTMKPGEIEEELIRDDRKLAGKTVYVQSGSSAVDCLRELNIRTGNRITVIEVPYETENLISLVARREIDFAVCDENIADVNSDYFPVLDVNTALTGMQNLGWGIRKENSADIRSILNEWISSFKNSSSYALVYAKYFRNTWSAYIFKSDYYTLNTGKVSQWDGYIKSFSDSLNWDWRLLASMIYQESRFKPHVTSPMGAYGLMQVMPATGRYFGIDIKSSPLNNMKAGIRYIMYLQDFFSSRIPDENERIKFILAAYNAGEGNIIDAMKLAEKHGRNPNIWDDNVEYYLLKKMEPDFYNDPVVQYGYCRGSESVNYVSEILDRYSHYRSIIPGETN